MGSQTSSTSRISVRQVAAPTSPWPLSKTVRPAGREARWTKADRGRGIDGLGEARAGRVTASVTADDARDSVHSVHAQGMRS